MTYLKDLIAQNNHKLVHYTEASDEHEYMSVFDYSVMYGGTYDSFKYYNNYVVEVK